MASWNEVTEALDACVGIPRAALHCVSGYPSTPEDYDLIKMRRYTKIHGVSDHTLGAEIPIAATALGAHIIEKHLCVSRSDPTEDAPFSMEPSEFKAMCKAARSTWEAIQPKSSPPVEDSTRQLRRSLYVTAHVIKGEIFTEANVRSVRPGYGLPPKKLPDVLGRVAQHDIERGTALREDMIE
jgi:N-acetylneuraminate synthase